jgi:hypothetical protein
MSPVVDDTFYFIFFLSINQIWWRAREVRAVGGSFIVW